MHQAEHMLLVSAVPVSRIMDQKRTDAGTGKMKFLSNMQICGSEIQPVRYELK